MDSVLDESLVAVDHEQVRCAPVVDFNDRVMNLSEPAAVRQVHRQAAQRGDERLGHRVTRARRDESTFGIECPTDNTNRRHPRTGGDGAESLAAALVCRQARAQLLSALALVAQATTTLAGAGLAAVDTAAMTAVAEEVELGVDFDAGV